MKYSYNSYKIPMFIVSFEYAKGLRKEVNFFNPDKAFNFYKKLRADSSIKHIKQYKQLISKAEKKEILLRLKNRKG